MTVSAPPPAILWFRDDLRLADHAALHAAATAGGPILPVFILDDAAAGRWANGGATRWWLHHSLTALGADLGRLGAPLVLRWGDSVDILTALVRETGAREVFTGGTANPWSRALDRTVASALEAEGVRLHRMRTTSLFAPDSIRTQAGGAYGVYTPFSRACLATGGPRDPIPAPTSLTGGVAVASDDLASWGLLPKTPDWAGGLRAHWTPGEAGALSRARAFIDENMDGYAARRDMPGCTGTSMLSPHLRFGEISAPTLWHMAYAGPGGAGREKFIKEVLWREFAINLLWHNPDLPETPLRPEFARMPWRQDAAGLTAWQRGRTGVPIVDAGMRQLWQTGWMHNRVRMIVASFLVKHLLIPWQDGAAWFWDTLVDADLANNAASWQWVAGCGADAAPYFRIFNPVLQGLKFDPDGAYVRRFVPELARVPDRFIQAPWEMAETDLARCGVVLGRHYPRPIVDLAHGRERALAAYAALKQSAE